MRVTQGSLSLRDFGKKLGVSGMFISDIYHGRRSPGPKILKYFGIGKNRRTVVEYVVFKK